MMAKIKYNWKITLWKGIKYLLFYGAPWAIFAWLDFYPQYASLSIGTILTWIANWLKHKK